MQSRQIASHIASHRDKLLWGFLGLLVVAQLAVFWMLCSQQVQKAEMRDASIRVQRVALADCLHRATLTACATQLQATNGGGDMHSTVPANFVFR
jgi:hypothetical protein